MQKSAISPRNMSLDVVRIIAIVGVIAIHTDVITASPTNYLGGLSWWFANTVHSWAAASIPLFALLTGALLLEKEEIQWKYVFTKSIKKFLLPLLFWWILVSLWQASKNNLAVTVPILLDNFYNSRIGHFYYLQIVVGLYLVSPLILTIWNRLSVKNRRVCLTAVTILSMAYNYGSYILFKTYGKTNVFLIAIPFITYLLWGKILANQKLNRLQIIVSAAVVVMLTAVTSAATYLNVVAFNSNQKMLWTPNSGNLFFEPFTLTILPMSVLTFLVILSLKGRLSALNRRFPIQQPLRYMAGLTFGIYLIHPYVLDFIDTTFHLSIQFISYPLWIYYLFKITAVTIVTGVIIAIFERIPVARVLIGK